MKREDAIAHGIEIQETKHSMQRRSPWHDYHSKGTYMLTLVVEGREPLLGELRGQVDAPQGSPDAPHVELTPLGHTILTEEIQKISKYYPQVEVWKLCLMPDHLHMIVRVKEDLPEGKHLGQVIAGFKGGCSKAAMRLRQSQVITAQSGRYGNNSQSCASVPPSAVVPPSASVPSSLASVPSSSASVPPSSAVVLPSSAPVPPSSASVPSSSPSVPSSSASVPPSAVVPPSASVPPPSGGGKPVPLFQPGYNDKILLREGQLATWKAYLDDNPRRLLIKRQHPQLFTVISGLEVAGCSCQVLGNRFLLDIPDKVAVIVHRRYTDDENARLRDEWLACGERGGVLVSAAISPKEKAVMREAMDRGYRIILLRENGFPPIYKPSGESFNACSEGLLLQISPWDFHMERKTITRAQCLTLNALAEQIAGEE